MKTTIRQVSLEKPAVVVEVQVHTTQGVEVESEQPALLDKDMMVADLQALLRAGQAQAQAVGQVLLEVTVDPVLPVLLVHREVLGYKAVLPGPLHIMQVEVALGIIQQPPVPLDLVEMVVAEQAQPEMLPVYPAQQTPVEVEVERAVVVRPAVSDLLAVPVVLAS